MNMQVDSMTKCAKVKQQKTYVICHCDAMNTQSCCILGSRTPLLVEVILPMCHTNFTTEVLLIPPKIRCGNKNNFCSKPYTNHGIINDTVDGRNPANQLRLLVHLSIYSEFTVKFSSQVVVWDFFHQL